MAGFCIYLVPDRALSEGTAHAIWQILSGDVDECKRVDSA
jgi:hypothetical protein